MATVLYQEIGRRIRRVRERLGMSQEELARRLDFNSPTTISYFESGERKISIADLKRVAAILRLPLAYFLEEQSDRSAVNHNIHFRAQEVRPSSRGAVAAFLAFAMQHGSRPARSLDLGKSQPGEAADRVLQITGSGGPPVMPREVATRLGVPVFDWDFPDDISGIFVLDGETVCIGVNEAHPHVRQRFTVAHELGHLVFGEERDIFVDFSETEAAVWLEDGRQQVLETKANQFAADLLMPRSWIRKDVQLRGLDVTLLSKRYEVSEQAMWFRLLSLKLVEETWVGERV